MTDGLKWTVNHVPGSDDKFLDLMSEENVTKANEFHKSFPQYSVTPLQKLSALASYLGVKGIYCKDESYRFGLNAFKVLGGSYAMGRYIAKELGRDISQLPYNVLSSDKLREEFGQATFFTATDGNHGRGVAWAAKRLGQKAVVRMPKGTTKTRFDNIAKEGAEVTIEEVNYDDCVRMAAAEAAKTEHGIIVQDTAWAGYEEIPSWIMQGYGTLVLEADKQLKENGVDRPTHVFVQAGVGSLAGAVVGYFAHKYKENPPVMVVCEASAADCLYRSAVQADGNLVNVTGDLQTIMAGLACGEGNTIGWDILKNHVTVFASCPDWMSAKATRIYANPLENDPHIISGESGSVPLGLAYTALHDEDAKDLKEALKLDENSNILVISTEGDTDPVRYREIVWDGLYGTTESLSK
ncbi:diaminopropionate ammonia-lyase [Blautia faecis]|uniref:diaminopropionate ammonia-lyase n=1 Tax=Blautia faecis TaxID=871665 RepID=UPI001D010166|nr:diaminopropionate ammonia-lyase [Blautia faecis]MCB5434949.1 diaminopropionate ammonia-lyase [Blautia faecis]